MPKEDTHMNQCRNVALQSKKDFNVRNKNIKFYQHKKTKKFYE